jgi:UDP-N-acetylmuramate dehydrogenase
MQIDQRIIDELSGLAPEAVREDEPMAKHTSFGLGGPVDVFVEPADAGAFRDVAAFLADEGVPTMILGRGTNVLVRSGGVEGAVLCSTNAFTEIARTEEGLEAGSGVALSKVLTLCSEEGLTGLEGLAGIPGSVGGAVKTNAGSFGDTIGDRLAEVVTFQPGKNSVVIPAEEIPVEYRRTILPEGAVVSLVRLRLDEAPPEDVERRRQETLEKKWRSQPTGMRSAGCIFRNPPGGSAGRMIDELGLKGTRVGGAVVSDLHAGFILNDRGGTADEVEELISIVRSRVLEETGIELVLEIEVVGRRAH